MRKPRRTLGSLDRLANMVGLGALRLTRSDEGLPRLQLEMLADEVLDDVSRHQDYGFSSAPLEGAEAVTVSLGGARGRSLAVVVSDRRFQIELLPGEVAIHDDQGQKVHLTRDGVVIETSKDVRVTAGGEMSLQATGPLSIEAGAAIDITATGDVTVQTDGAASVTAAGDATLTAAKAVVDAAEVRLVGDGAGAKVARVGDAVSGGVITGPGSAKVYA